MPQLDNRRKKLNKTDRKKSVTCEENSFGFGRKVRSMVIAVNVKPQKRDSTLVRFDNC